MVNVLSSNTKERGTAGAMNWAPTDGDKSRG